jgi:hypothetical protein
LPETDKILANPIVNAHKSIQIGLLCCLEWYQIKKRGRAREEGKKRESGRK